MLQKFAANLSHGIYTHANLLFLLCNSEAGRAVANQAGDPMTMADEADDGTVSIGAGHGACRVSVATAANAVM